MAERTTASRTEPSQTVTVDEADTSVNQSPTATLRLKCKKPKSEKNVKWNEGIVDNENMNKKKSKCCCIYKKPKQRFDESSDSESDECEKCFGHPEVKKQKKLAKANCSGESAPSTSKEVTLEHAQPSITFSGS